MTAEESDYIVWVIVAIPAFILAAPLIWLAIFFATDPNRSKRKR